MDNAFHPWRRFVFRAMAGWTVPILFPLLAAVQAEESSSFLPGGIPLALPAVSQPARSGGPPAAASLKDPAPAKEPAKALEESGPPLCLAACIAIALEKQPNVTAARIDLANAQRSAQGVENARVPTFIVHDFPYRKQQAILGVTVSAAALDVAERETVYSVTRMYWTVIYARAQLELTNSAIRQLSDSLANGERLLAAGAKEITQNSVDRNRVFLALAQTKHTDAEEGVKRAMAALREAMGVGPDFCFSVPEDKFPEPDLKICKEEIINLALTHRGEIVQAVTGSEVTSLEVKAQGASHRFKKETFASLTDIHARGVPQGIMDGEYRPGALGLAMPPILAGSRSSRVESATNLNMRAGSTVDKTRNLVALEAEDTYLRWETAHNKIEILRQPAKDAEESSKRAQEDFNGLGVNYREFLESAFFEAQTKATLNDALYQQVLTLAALERVTAGGFSAGLAGQGCQAP